jgi:hypothetical protein
MIKTNKNQTLPIFLIRHNTLSIAFENPFMVYISTNLKLCNNVVSNIQTYQKNDLSN